MSTGAGFTNKCCGSSQIRLRALLANVHIDRILVGTGVCMHIGIVGTVCPVRLCVGLGIGTVVDILVVACGKTCREDGTKKDYCK